MEALTRNVQADVDEEYQPCFWVNQSLSTLLPFEMLVLRDT